MSSSDSDMYDDNGGFNLLKIDAQRREERRREELAAMTPEQRRLDAIRRQA